MTATFAVVANVYNEANALPGWLEAATSFADWVGVMHAGPRGQHSNDGTLDILRKWRIPTQFCEIDDGFGVVRTKTLRMCPPGIDWIMLLDADERFYRFLPTLTCSGESTPAQVVDDLLYDYGNPNFDKDGPRRPLLGHVTNGLKNVKLVEWDNPEPRSSQNIDSLIRQVVQPYDSSIDFVACPSNFENMALLGANLRVSYSQLLNYGQIIREIALDDELDAIPMIRRHWHDFTMRRPTQNWHTEPDYQMRVLRNKESIYFAQDTRMHERVVGLKNVYDCDFTVGPFIDHFHLPMKRLEADQRRHDVAVYNAISRGEPAPIWEEFNGR